MTYIFLSCHTHTQHHREAHIAVVHAHTHTFTPGDVETYAPTTNRLTQS